MLIAEQRTMTIPSRPAPAPPGSQAQNAAAGANASLEQLRQQLQHQQQQHKQQSIKLPPPPKGAAQHSHYTSSSGSSGSNAASITRKFPQARYSPATNWDDTPFNGGGVSNSSSAPPANSHFRKVPPPRPPPPKVQTNVRKATPAPAKAVKILSNIIHRKKTAASTLSSKASAGGAARVYGVSSGTYGSVTTTTMIGHSASYAATNSNGSYATNGGGFVNWNAWNDSGRAGYTFATSSSTTTTTSATNGSGVQEAQLISFDSPPSSPTFTQKSNSDCVSVDSFSSDSNFSSPNNGSVSQPESGFEDDFSAATTRSRPPTTSPLDPWETTDAYSGGAGGGDYAAIGTAPVRNVNASNTRTAGGVDNPLCNGKSLLPPAQSLAMPTIIKPKISQKPKAPKPPPPMALVFQNGYNNNNKYPCGDDLNTPPSPPMPKCAPPPPPQLAGGATVSLLDVISGKVDAIHLGGGASYGEEAPPQPYGVALYDFDGIEEGDLNFRENEKIYLLEQVNEEWCRGRTRSGCEGIFPITYIDIKVPLVLADAATSVATPTQTAHGHSRQLSVVQCLYNFPAEVEGDLALKENDMVTILYRINEDWLYGEIDGRQGQFPENFLEYVPANIPLS